MERNWLKLRLRDVGVTLIDCDHRTPPAADNGYPYVTIPHLKEGRIDVRDARRITPDHFDEWTRKANPRAFDVVLSRRCNPGESAFVPPGLEFALGQNLVLLRADGSKLAPPFLRWLVRGPAWWDQVEKFINSAQFSIAYVVQTFQTSNYRFRRSTSNAPSPTSSAPSTTRSS
jgi:type I restriction enzyme, S subunit